MAESKQTTELVEAIINSIVLVHEVAADVGEYIENITPKVMFEAAITANSRPSKAEREQIRTYEREIMRHLNVLKHMVSGLQIRSLDTIDALSEAELVTQLAIVEKPPPQLSELKRLIDRLKKRELDVFDAEKVHSVYYSTYKIFADTLNEQIEHYNTTYKGSLPKVGTLA